MPRIEGVVLESEPLPSQPAAPVVPPKTEAGEAAPPGSTSSSPAVPDSAPPKKPAPTPQKSAVATDPGSLGEDAKELLLNRILKRDVKPPEEEEGEGETA